MNGNDPIFLLDTTALRQRSVRGAAVTSGAQAIKFFLLLGSQILLARLLNPADFGIIAMVAPILGFVTVMSDMGIGQAIVQSPVITGNQLNSAFWLTNLLTLVMSMLLMLVAPLLSWLYHEPRLISVTIALASLVAVTGFSMQQSALLNRTMRFSALAISETVSQSFGLAVSAFAAWKGFGYWSLVMGQATTTVTTGLVVWIASPWRPSSPQLKANAFALLKFGGNVTVSNIALYLNTVLDNVLIGYYLGAVLLGIYDRAWKLVVLPLSQLMAPINRVAVPTLSRLTNEPQRYRNAFGQMFGLLLFVSLPGLAVCVIDAQPMIDVLFGPKWHAVAPAFSWLCLGSLLTPVNTVTFWIFVSQGRPRDQMIYGTGAAVVNILTYVVGVHWGLLGVTRTSTIVAYVLTTPMLVWAASRSGPINKRFFVHLLLPYFISTLGAMAVTITYGSLVGNKSLLHLIAIALLAYLITIPIQACFSSGRSTLRGAVTTLRALTSRHR